MTHGVFLRTVIRLRLLLMLGCALFCARELLAAAARVQMPTRQQVLLIQVPPPAAEPIAKLPPPVAPGMNKAASVTHHPDLPSDVEIETNTGPAPAIAAKAVTPAVHLPTANEPDPDAARKVKIKTERTRLNHNAFVWQQERAAGGSASAQRSLAFRYLTGDGVERDDVKGMDLLRKAATGGDSAAQKELAKRETAKKE